MFVKKRNQSSQRRGASALEFAMIAPTFLLIIFCCCEFARISMLRNVAQNAAYEAARFVIVDGSTTEHAIDEANSILGRLGTNAATITVNGGEELSFNTPNVTVRIEIPMKDNSFVFPSVYGDKKIIAEVTLRTERYQGYYDGGTGDGS